MVGEKIEKKKSILVLYFILPIIIIKYHRSNQRKHDINRRRKQKPKRRGKSNELKLDRDARLLFIRRPRLLLGENS